MDGFSAVVGEAEIVGLIGPNGAGKSTLLNCISGLHPIDGGEIRLNKTSLNRLKPFQVTKLGIGRTFQISRLFLRMNLVENVIAPSLDTGSGLGYLRKKGLELLEEVELHGLRDQFAEELSGGQQKLLEFARLMMFDPVLILLDEPFAGVHPDIKGKLYERILKLQHEGKGFILVSHELHAINALCERVIFMHNGRGVVEGTMEEIESNHTVMEAYLGRNVRTAD